MNRAFVAFFMLTSLAGHAAAADMVGVRSGEHADFSRLVIETQGPQEWTLETSARQATVILHGSFQPFDTSAIFTKIPHTRIAEVTSVETGRGYGLRISLACSCQVDVFETQDHKIVADVKSAETWQGPPESEPATLLAAEAIAAADAPATRPESLFAPNMLAFPILGDQPSAVEALRPDTMFAGHESDDSAAAANASMPLGLPGEMGQGADDQSVAADVEAARNSLMQQLLRSVDQGLIEFADAEAPVGNETPDAASISPPGEIETDTPAPVTMQVIDAPAAAAAETFPAGVDAPGRAGQVTAETVFDRDQPALVAEPAAIADVCPPAGFFDLESWAGAGPFYDQVSELAATMLGEFDRPNPQITEKLVKLYLSAGFGVEALDLLDEFGQELPDRQLLADLAMIAEGRRLAETRPVPLSVNCSDQTAFWALLAAEPAAGAVSVSPEIVADVFASLPLNLRRHLGPRVGELLLDQGQIDAAERIYFLLARAAGADGADLQLLQARLDIARQRPMQAASLLQRLVAQDSAYATAAILELTELTLAMHWEIDVSLAENLSSRIGPHKNTPFGYRLKVAEMYLRAGSSELDNALGLLRMEMQQHPERAEENGRLLAELFLAANPQPGHFGEYAAAVLRHADLLGDTEPHRRARLNIADKLREVGLADDAIALLSPMLAVEDADARLVAAAAAADTSDLAQAATWLRNLQGLQADALRERVLVAGGSMPVSPGAAGSDQHSAWVLGNWPSVADHGEEPYRTLARYMLARGGAGAVDPIGPQLPETGAVAAAPAMDVFQKVTRVPDEITLGAARDIVSRNAALVEIVTEMLTATAFP